MAEPMEVEQSATQDPPIQNSDPPPTQDPDPNPNPPPPPPADPPPPPPASAPAPPPQQEAAPPLLSPPPPASETAPQKQEAVPPPPPPPPSPPAAASQSKKRPPEVSAQIQDCSYFKMRAVLKDMRPHFLEVLQTQDFRNCKGAHEIQEKLKLLMELYKQMTAERVILRSITKGSFAESQPPSVENGTGRGQPQPDRDSAKPSENKPFELVNATEKEPAENGESHGSYIVGGSAFGWNFIAYAGSDPEYYGRTKEAFRAAQAVAQ